MKRFKLKSLSDLPDYEELMQKIAELNAIEEISSNYLYEKEVYDPDNDPDLIAENAEEGEAKEAEDLSSGGFELPDFLDDIKDGIIKIQ